MVSLALHTRPAYLVRLHIFRHKCQILSFSPSCHSIYTIKRRDLHLAHLYKIEAHCSVEKNHLQRPRKLSQHSLPPVVKHVFFLLHCVKLWDIELRFYDVKYFAGKRHRIRRHGWTTQDCFGGMLALTLTHWFLALTDIYIHGSCSNSTHRT